jgi:hypothetical protein
MTDTTKLEQLFNIVTDAFIEKVQGGEQVVVNKDGDEVTIQVKPTAAELAAAVTFLKNNNITATPSDNNALGKLDELVKAREAKRAERRASMLRRAEEQMDGFPGGMH